VPTFQISALEKVRKNKLLLLLSDLSTFLLSPERKHTKSFQSKLLSFADLNQYVEHKFSAIDFGQRNLKQLSLPFSLRIRISLCGKRHQPKIYSLISHETSQFISNILMRSQHKLSPVLLLADIKVS